MKPKYAVWMAAETSARLRTLALLTISWPFMMPPSSNPMMTRTMATSTSEKPFCLPFIWEYLPVPL
jgi:hypothetical protein